MLGLVQRFPTGLPGVAAHDRRPFRTLAGFPRFAIPATAASAAVGDGLPRLNAFAFGGNQLDGSLLVPFAADVLPNGECNGIPLVLHNASGAAVIMGPASHFLAAIHTLYDAPVGTAGNTVLSAGLKQSLVAGLPESTEHVTLLVAGSTVRRAFRAYGDALLTLGNKQRLDPYDDPVLAQLGYWTDRGAYLVREGVRGKRLWPFQAQQGSRDLHQFHHCARRMVFFSTTTTHRSTRRWRRRSSTRKSRRRRTTFPSSTINGYV
jgi:hypothetical protein